MEMAVFNSFFIWTIIHGKKIHHRDYRIDLVEHILENDALPNRASPGCPSKDNPMRLQSKAWGHFPMLIPPTEKETISHVEL